MFDSGPGGFAVTSGLFDWYPSLSIRWKGGNYLGYPQMHGHPTYFNVPEELNVDLLLALLNRHAKHPDPQICEYVVKIVNTLEEGMRRLRDRGEGRAAA